MSTSSSQMDINNLHNFFQIKILTHIFNLFIIFKNKLEYLRFLLKINNIKSIVFI